MTAGLLLAAGAGRRFGRPKALVEVDGRPLVARGVDLLRDGGCDPVVVVLGAQADRVRPLVTGARTVVAELWDEGMGASLRAGLAALQDSGAEACIVALVDQPRVTPAAVARLLATGGEAAVATYAGQPRNPVRLARAVWAEVAALAVGDTGARAWLRAHPDRVVAVPCDDVADPADVDTPADLSRLLEEPA
jgi:CTP:molybdopterin cytidylyltransferase MocA